MSKINSSSFFSFIRLFFKSCFQLQGALLIFPVIVTLLVGISFLFHGKCAIWQWWIGVCVGAILSLRQQSIKQSIFNLIIFGLTIFTVKTLSNLFFDSTADGVMYHFPGIRSLILGWNPIYDGTKEGWENFIGLSSDKMRFLHFISLPKSLYFFSAAAYFFVNAPCNLLFPLVPLMYICVSITLWSTLTSKTNFTKILSILLAFILISPQMLSPAYHLDRIIALCSLGLIASLCSVLKLHRVNYIELFVYTFWMMTLKQTSLLQAFLIWCIFIVFTIMMRLKIQIKSFIIFFLILFIGFSVVSISPYITSSFNYTHPLYPRYSFNEEKFPISNQTRDFSIRNDDATKMGHLGAYVNAYISSRLSNFYYGKVYGKQNFYPIVNVWGQQGVPQLGTPTYASCKLLFCFSVLLFFISKSCYKLIAIIMIACTLALPSDMIGFLRYTPFILMVTCFIPEVIGYFNNKHTRIVLSSIFTIVIFGYLVQSKTFIIVPVYTAQAIDNAYAMKYAIKNTPPYAILPWGYHNYNDEIHVSEAEIELLKRMIPSFSMTKTYSINSQMYNHITHNCIDSLRGVSNGIFLTNDAKFIQNSVFLKYNLENEDPNKRRKAIPLNALKVFLFILPKSLTMDFK